MPPKTPKSSEKSKSNRKSSNPDQSNKSPKTSQRNDKNELSNKKKSVNSSMIRSPAVEKEKDPTPGRRGGGNNNDSNKGILKKKKSFKGEQKMPGEKKKKVGRAKKATAYEQLMRELGFTVGKVILKDPKAIEAAQALDLSQWHIQRLKARFDKIDIDGSGNIDYDEFFESVGELRSPFTDKLFALIDLDGSGTIEFDEYVRVMATYCMFSQDEILRFCFECFDVDRSGTIDEKEFIELCKTINNASPTFPSNFRRALEEFDVNDDGLIDYSEFLLIDKRYPLMLFPAFRLQDVMQRNSLGETVWVKVIENYRRRQAIEDYKAEHGGRLPPDSPLVALGKVFLPCFFREKVHISVGAEMEARHREDV
eukprot:gene5503-7618_t